MAATAFAPLFGPLYHLFGHKDDKKLAFFGPKDGKSGIVGTQTCLNVVFARPYRSMEMDIPPLIVAGPREPKNASV